MICPRDLGRSLVGLVVLLGLSGPLHASAPPARVVALAPHLVEMVYALGAEARLVGAVEWSDHPPAAAALPRVGDAFRVSLEAVVALQPDLVLAWRDSASAADLVRLQQLGIPVWISAPRNLEDIADELESLTDVLQADPTVAAGFAEEVSALGVADTPAETSVLVLVNRLPVMAVTDRSFVSGLVQRCGGTNVVGQAPGTVIELSREALLTLPVDLVLPLTPESVDPALVPGARWHHIDPDWVSRPGPRALLGAREICRILGSRADVPGSPQP